MHGLVGVVILVGGLMLVGKLFASDNGGIIIGGLIAMAAVAWLLVH